MVHAELRLPRRVHELLERRLDGFPPLGRRQWNVVVDGALGEVAEQVVEDAAQLGVSFVWMQPGAESARALEIAAERGVEAIGDGSCLLVVVGYREG